jgi:hypothetical protein
MLLHLLKSHSIDLAACIALAEYFHDGMYIDVRVFLSWK